MNKSLGTSGNPRRRTRKGGDLRSFGLAEKESAYLGKMTKGKVAKRWV